MKIAINACYGGFSLSPLAIKYLANLKGKECYFFKGFMRDDIKPAKFDELENDLFFSAYSVPNPDWELMKTPDPDGRYCSFRKYKLGFSHR